MSRTAMTSQGGVNTVMDRNEARQEEQRATRRWGWPMLLVCVLLLAHVGLAWVARPTHIRTGQDDAWYLLLGRSLRQFRYVDLYVVGEPIHQLYPPGYPAVLGFLGALFGENLQWISVLGVLFSVTTVGLVFLGCRRIMDERVALAVTAALAFNAELLARAGAVMSEPLFMLLAVASVFLLQEPTSNGKRAAAGVLAIAAALTRTIGVTLIIGLGIYWLVQRRWRACALLALGSIATIGLWIWWTAVAPDQFIGKSYIADATFVRKAPSVPLAITIRSLRSTLFYLSDAIPTGLAFPTIQGTPLDNLVSISILTLGLTVGLVAILRRWPAAGLFLTCYAGLLLIWPWRLLRYVAPMLPLIIPTVLLGLFLVARRVNPKRAWILPCAIALVLATTGFLKSVHRIREAGPCDRSTRMPQGACISADQASFFAALRYIEDRLPDDAVIATAKAAPLYFYTGHKTPPVGAVMAQSAESLLPFLRESGTSYILLARLHSLEASSLLPAVTANCNAFELIQEFPPSVYLLRFVEPGSEPIGTGACAAVKRYQTIWPPDRPDEPADR
ncbi:MAG: hypothetical protein ACREMQ_09640 [Longimicrobiales bacterium]